MIGACARGAAAPWARRRAASSAPGTRPASLVRAHTRAACHAAAARCTPCQPRLVSGEAPRTCACYWSTNRHHTTTLQHHSAAWRCSVAREAGRAAPPGAARPPPSPASPSPSQTSPPRSGSTSCPALARHRGRSHLTKIAWLCRTRAPRRCRRCSKVWLRLGLRLCSNAAARYG